MHSAGRQWARRRTLRRTALRSGLVRRIQLQGALPDPVGPRHLGTRPIPDCRPDSQPGNGTRPKPRRPPNTPGPAVTIEPACGVAAVCTAQAVDPNSETTTPPIAAAREDLAPSDARPEQDHCGRDDGADRDDRPQPCVPTRSAREQRRRPERGDEDRGGADGAREERLAVLPHEVRPDADERGDRGRERNRVVLVEDPLHQAEHNRGDDEPPAPHDDRGTGRVGAGRTARHPQAGDGEEQCRGHQPRDLTTDHPVEHAREASAAPHTGADAAGLLTRQPAEAVVAERELEDAVVLRAPDEGA